MPTTRELEQRYANARTAVRNGEYAEALEGLLFYFDHAQSAVRLSYTLDDIMSVSEHLPEAREALVARRDARVATVLRGDGDWDDLMDIRSLNKYLEEADKTHALLKQLLQSDGALRQLGDQLTRLIWEDLALAGQAQQLEPIAEENAVSVAGSIAFFHARWDFAETEEEQSLAFISVRNSLSEAILAYQTLLTLGKHEIANRLERSVTSCELLPEAESLFAEAAKQAAPTVP